MTSFQIIGLLIVCLSTHKHKLQVLREHCPTPVGVTAHIYGVMSRIEMSPPTHKHKLPVVREHCPTPFGQHIRLHTCKRRMCNAKYQFSKIITEYTNTILKSITILCV